MYYHISVTLAKESRFTFTFCEENLSGRDVG